MRQLAIVPFVIALVLMPAASQAAEKNRLLQGRNSEWLDAARDYIVRKPTLRPDANCGSPFACSLIAANTSARCEALAGSLLFAAHPTLHLYGAVYYFDGRVKPNRKAVDKAVIDGSSAVTHEYEWHIIPAALGLVPLLEQLKAARFDSLAACEVAAKATSKAVVEKFRELLADTQRHELAFGTRPVERVARFER